jgi:hypothetical protein
MLDEHFQIPDTFGECADKVYRIREAKRTLKREIDILTKEENLLKRHIIEKLPEEGATGVQGERARVTIVDKEVPTVADQAQFRTYLYNTGRFDLANKIVPNPKAVREMWEEGEEVAGISKFECTTLSITKL